MLVVIVGCLGLASNVIGLFLFHGEFFISTHQHADRVEHGHAHGGHSHSHGDEESDSQSQPATPAIVTSRPADDETTALLRSTAPLGTSPSSHAHNESFSSLYGHPAQTRAAVIETAAEFGYGRDVLSPSASSRRAHLHALPREAEEAHPEGSSASASTAAAAHDHVHGQDANAQAEKDDDHAHGHSHGNMNMHGVFLHVLGDALGNVGVIAAGLVIWLYVV